MNKKEEAGRLLESMKMIFLVTAGEDGRPDARAISAVKSEGLGTVWMMTGKCSDKYKELSKDPRCMIYATDLEDTANYLELRLWGRVELLDDPASRAFAWLDEYTCYFPAGKDDPNLVVLKFTADSGVLQTVDGKQKLEF